MAAAERMSITKSQLVKVRVIPVQIYRLLPHLGKNPPNKPVRPVEFIY